MAQSVSTYIERERLEKIKEREEKKRLDEYHARIMNPLYVPPLPPILDDVTATDSQHFHTSSSGNILGPKHLSRIASVASLGAGNLTRSNASEASKPKILSMSTSLGSKAKAFGSIGSKKKVKKKTKKKGRSKKKKK